MNLVRHLMRLVRISQSQHIARRYFVVNGFDGGLAMLGLTMGFYASGEVSTAAAVSACLGTAIALAVSGVSSSYISESAEREKELRELEQAMVADLDRSIHAEAAQLVPIYVAGVNGMAPFAVSLIVITPLWLSEFGVWLPVSPIAAAIVTAFAVIFALGIIAGRVSGAFWLWAGLRTLLVALVTAGVILVVAG